jgi:hypothetical protein
MWHLSTRLGEPYGAALDAGGSECRDSSSWGPDLVWYQGV